MWLLFFFLNLFGNSLLCYNIVFWLLLLNYEVVNMSYVGVLVVVVFVFSLCFLCRDGCVCFFVVLMVLWFVYAFNFFGASCLFVFLLMVDIVLINCS